MKNFVTTKLRQLSALIMILALCVAPTTNQAFAQKGRGLPLVRDAEIEALIKQYTAPIFQAAGLNRNAIKVYLLNRSDFNAFVSQTRMFVNTGAIMQSKTPNELIGVFAHETGHIIGGHLVRMRQRIEQAQLISILALLAGAGAAAAGSSEAGAALATAGGSAAQRSFLSYQREEEMAADRSGLTLLNKTQQSGLGMLNTFRRLGENPLFSSGKRDPYTLSHPLPRERIALLTGSVSKSPYFNKKDPADLQLKHNFARAKIAAYAGGLGLVKSVFGKNFNSDAGNYGAAIAYHLRGIPNKALSLINRLLKKYPKSPYINEMKGEILLRAGKPNKAVKSFSKAISLDKSQSSLIRVELGHALLETNNKANLDKAIKTIKAGIGRDRYTPRAYGLLARAYYAKGNQSLAIAATAEQKFWQGNTKEAKNFAKRALAVIPSGSPQWLRLQDIVNYSPQK